MSDDLRHPAPLRTNAPPYGRHRTQYTLRDYMPGPIGPLPEARRVAAPDPAAWRTAILATYSARQSTRPPVQPSRAALEVQRLGPPPRWQRRQRAQSLRPVGASSCPHSPRAHPVADTLPVERSGQPLVLLRQASPRLAAPIPCTKFNQILELCHPHF